MDPIENIAYYTTLIISCKKTDSSLWSFLTYEKPKTDPNFKYFLNDNCSNDNRISIMLNLNNEIIKSCH